MKQPQEGTAGDDDLVQQPDDEDEQEQPEGEEDEDPVDRDEELGDNGDVSEGAILMHEYGTTALRCTAAKDRIGFRSAGNGVTGSRSSRGQQDDSVLDDPESERFSRQGRQVKQVETDEDEEEAEEAYRLRVYGIAATSDNESDPGDAAGATAAASLRRLSRRVSRQIERRRSSVSESLPDTPRGWAALATTVGAATLAYEALLQHHLTSPPHVFGQIASATDGARDTDDSCNPTLNYIYKRMADNRDRQGNCTKILSRPIRPSLFVGTRAGVSSAAAYLFGGPSAPTGNKKYTKFHERMTMTQDGASVALDWELPPAEDGGADTVGLSEIEKRQRKELAENAERRCVNEVLHGPIENQVVVLILHGINNDSEFGYVRSLMRACTDRGWIACGMNFRGCGRSKPHTTPRSYNGAYTGDLRCVVWKLSARMTGIASKLFLVGNSLGANILTKYLGEEGLSGTLPKCVAGGVALGNPLSTNTPSMSKCLSPSLAMGVKKTLLENWGSIGEMFRGSAGYRTAIRKALLALTLGETDAALANTFIRNDTTYPFAFRVGFENGETYWKEGSSYHYVRHVSVPMLQLISGDDFLVFHPFRGRMLYCLQNPNVMVVETKCGGHLGWQEAPPDSDSLFGLGGTTSWSDLATTDFIAAVLDSDSNLQRDDRKISSDTTHGANYASAMRSRL